MRLDYFVCCLISLKFLMFLQIPVSHFFPKFKAFKNGSKHKRHENGSISTRQEITITKPSTVNANRENRKFRGTLRLKDRLKQFERQHYKCPLESGVSFSLFLSIRSDLRIFSRILWIFQFLAPI